MMDNAHTRHDDEATRTRHVQAVSHGRCCHEPDGTPRRGIVYAIRRRRHHCCHEHVPDEVREYVDDRVDQVSDRLDVIESHLRVLAPDEIAQPPGKAS